MAKFEASGAYKAGAYKKKRVFVRFSPGWNQDGNRLTLDSLFVSLYGGNEDHISVLHSSDVQNKILTFWELIEETGLANR